MEVREWQDLKDRSISPGRDGRGHYGPQVCMCRASSRGAEVVSPQDSGRVFLPTTAGLPVLQPLRRRLPDRPSFTTLPTSLQQEGESSAPPTRQPLLA